MFAWVNDAATRAESFGSDPINWEDHERWFARVLRDPTRVLWLLEQDKQPVGGVRFDAVGERSTISVQISPEQRGRGLGVRLVLEASALYVSATGRLVDAFIKPTNARSAATFERAGYRHARALPDGTLHFVLESKDLAGLPQLVGRCQLNCQYPCRSAACRTA